MARVQNLSWEAETPTNQGSVERVNADIRDMTVTWMRENSGKDWQVGMKFVQFQEKP